jgi:hypothetical protein
MKVACPVRRGESEDGPIGTASGSYPTNARYLGRGRPRTLRLLPDGRVLSARAVSKLRACRRCRPREQGWRYAAGLLEQAGADPAPAEGAGDLAAWAAAWLPRLTRPLRHPGNHRYAFALDKALRPALPSAVAYPKVLAA